MEITTKGLVVTALIAGLGLAAVKQLFNGESDDPLTDKNTPECIAYRASQNAPGGLGTVIARLGESRLNETSTEEMDRIIAGESRPHPNNSGEALRRACEESVESPTP